MSSATPRPCTEKSLAYVIETSTLRVELFVFGRVTDQCSQPSLGPLMAFRAAQARRHARQLVILGRRRIARLTTNTVR